ncbi:MAG: hypothetical protein ACOYXW_06785 [Actinomycetota bacterium]
MYEVRRTGTGPDGGTLVSRHRTLEQAWQSVGHELRARCGRGPRPELTIVRVDAREGERDLFRLAGDG